MKRINRVLKGCCLMNELQEYLNEQEGTEKDTFTVDDENKANWALRKIRDLKYQIEQNNALATAEIDKIEQWQQEVNSSAQDSIDYFQGLLAEYAMQKKKDDPKFKTMKLPNGRFGFRKRQPKWNYDDDAVLRALEKANLDDFIRVKKTPSKDDIKKAFDVVNGKVISHDTGEVIDDITVVYQDESFGLTVNQ